MAAAAVDVAYIATSYAVDQTTLTTLLDAPTVELVKSLLEQLTNKAREHDELEAERLRRDVELETAIREGESRSRNLKANVEKSLKDVEELRAKLNQEETSRTELQVELDKLRSNTSSSISETQALHSRIASLESSNRDTLSLLEAKSKAHDRLADELSAQQQKAIALRKDVAALEEKQQSAENAMSGARFREQGLQSEVELLRKNVAWHESELETRTNDYTRYRKEKGARVSELQRANEEAAITIESLKRTESSLRSRIDEITNRADESLTKIQQLQEAAARAEDSFKIELDSSRRLAELQQQSAETARRRLQDVQGTLDQVKEDAADEIGRIQAELETERSEKIAAVNKFSRLELQLEQPDTHVSILQNDELGPSTPTQLTTSTNGGRRGGPGSDIFSPGSARTKGGRNNTQLYMEHGLLKKEIEKERKRNQKLTASIEEIIGDLESKQPEIDDLRAEHDRMVQELSEHAHLVDEANTARESARKEARSWEGQAHGFKKEAAILRQQLRDLSAQVKMLLVEIQAREDGLNGMSTSERVQLEQMARQEIFEDDMPDATPSERYISRHLTIFRNVRELQDQNSKLLNITRELSERSEGQEARDKRHQHERDQEELAALRERISQYQDEMKSLISQSESYVRERDMFRKMIAQRGAHDTSRDGNNGIAQFSKSTSGVPISAGLTASNENNSNVELADFQKLVREIQAQFDTYRRESATDQNSLKQQANLLAKEKATLQGEISRVTSQLTLAHERYEMLNSNHNALKEENTQAQKRLQSQTEMSAKQELRTQEVAEELVEARSLSESVRHENSTLKAEKELLKSMEGRLTEENRALLDDRSRLNKMVSDIQGLQHERELVDTDTRRRLQDRVESLESDVKTAQRKYDEEAEDNKKANLRREYEQEQNRQRIDDLAKSLSSVREELVAAKTTRDQLQVRVDEMKVELRSAEERLGALQPTRQTTSNSQNATSGNEAVPNAAILDRNQELATEISELKRELGDARKDVQDAQNDAEQYRAISQSAEDELNSINETHDLYRDEMDHALTSSEEKIKELGQRIDDLSSELSRSNNELSELRTSNERRVSQWEEQKSSFDSEIARLKDENDRLGETVRLSQEDLKAQANIASQAQQNYDSELVKHAEAAKALQKLRSDYNGLKIEIVEAKAGAETAKTALEQNESSWSEMRNRYENELTEIRQRREEIQGQNRILHEQLESFSTQIATLRQNRMDYAETVSEADHSGSASERLQEVITYLRREKEIVEVQHELSIKEGSRLKSQLDYAQAQLDEARQKLTEERLRQANAEQNAASHTKLIQTINELNLFRESSTTLRAEARQAQSKLTSKTEEVERLTEQLQPLQERVLELESQLEMNEGERKLLEEDRDRWRQRTQDIISKYNRVDPAELEELKTQAANLQREKETAETEKQALQAQIDTIPQQLAEVKEEAEKNRQELRERLGKQFKEKARGHVADQKKAEADAETARKEMEGLSQELNAVKLELSTLKTAVEQNKEQNNTAGDGTNNTVRQSSESLEEGQVHEGQADSDALAALRTELEQVSSQLVEKSDQLVEQSNQLSIAQTTADERQTRINELEARLVELQNQIDSLGENEPGSSAPTGQEQKTAHSGEGGVDDTDAIQKQVEEQVSSIRAQLEGDHQAKIAQEEARYKDRAESLKKQMNSKLRELRDNLRNELAEEHQAALDQLRAEKDAEIEKLRTDHREEMQRLQTEADAALQEAKRITSEAQSTSNPGETPQAKLSGDNSAIDDTSVEPANLPDGWTDAQVKQFVSSNRHVKAMVARNIQTKVAQEKEKLVKEENEGLQAKLTEEREKLSKQHEEAVAELRKKADAAKDNAVMMTEKRTELKMGMLKKQNTTANLKIEIVEKAAQETPQRPVKEVWDIAKVAKPPQPALAPTNAPAQASDNAGIEQTQASNAAAPSAATEPTKTEPQASTGQAVQGNVQAPSNPSGPNQQPQMNVGTGPAALRGIIGQGQSTGIPRRNSISGRGTARGGRGGLQGPGLNTQAQQQSQMGAGNIGTYQNQRGSTNLPRGPGRGRGSGRGFQPNMSGMQGNNQGGGPGGSPGGASSTNPDAKQFFPGGTGQKRGREDGGDDTGGDNGPKRVRGGRGGR
ncbi:MAG: hypothetical protein M1820_000398 [Bogoriella megaspora]|nr:MAG: hypothetical protein M1820_000398 [Bogoriella megaspora]